MKPIESVKIGDRIKCVDNLGGISTMYVSFNDARKGRMGLYFIINWDILTMLGLRRLFKMKPCLGRMVISSYTDYWLCHYDALNNSGQ